MWRIARGIYNWFVYPWRKTEILEWTEKQAKKLRDRIFEYKKKQCTIAIVGLTGQGKSSFINAVFSALKGRLVFPASTMIVRGEQPTTKKVVPHFLDKDENIRLLDSQGYGDRTDKENLDEFNIEVMKSILSTGKWLQTNEKKETTEYAVDAVILCVEYTTKFSESKNKTLTREIVRLLANCNIPVFLMITQIDNSEKNKDDFIVRDIFKDARFSDAVRAASQLSKLDENRILLQCNYNTKSQTTDVEKNILTLYNLCFVLETVFSRHGFF